MKTAQEILDYHTKQCKGTVKTAMKEFAKLHVKAALAAASHVLDVNNDADYIKHPTKERILSSYKLENIK